MFDTHIDLGNILTIVALIGTLWRFHQSNVKRIHAIEFRVEMMWKHFAHRFNLPENIGETDS